MCQASKHLAIHVLTIDLSDVSTTLHTDSDVHSSKALLAQQQNGLQQLHIMQDNTGSISHTLCIQHPSQKKEEKAVRDMIPIVLLLGLLKEENKDRLSVF